MRIRTVATVCLLVSGVAAAGATLLPSLRSNARTHRLVAALVRQPATGLLPFALASGCLEEAGVELDERAFEQGREALDLLRAGGADVAVALETPVLRAAFLDPRLRVLSELHRSEDNTRLVGRRDRGVDDVRDLRGRRVGVAAGSNAEFFLDALLRAEGMRTSDVVLVDLEPRVAVERLAAKRIDAAALSDPHAQRAEALLGVEAVVLNTELYDEASLLVTREDVLADRRLALEALVRGLACAERRARERPADAFAAMRVRFPEIAEPELKRQLDRVEWRLGLDHVLLAVLRREREWLDRRGAAGTPPDLARLVESSVLEAAAPQAVLLLPAGDP